MKQKLQRNHAMTFRVTEEERSIILEKMKHSGILNMRHFFLKMIFEGRVINVEMNSIQEMNRLLSNISNNINQIARRVNGTGKIYASDVEKIREDIDRIWERQTEIHKILIDVMDAVG